MYIHTLNCRRRTPARFRFTHGFPYLYQNVIAEGIEAEAGEIRKRELGRKKLKK
jgi:hypothetical protein